MINKKSEHFDFFLSHLYDDISRRYDMDGDQTRSLVKYLRSFHNNNDKTTLNHLKNHGDKESLEKILAKIHTREEKVEMREDSMREYFPFAVPEGMTLRQTNKNIPLNINKKGKDVKAGPSFTIPVTDEEKALAKQVRKSFEDLIKKQKDFVGFLEILFDHLEELDNTTGLIKISPLIKKYEYKMKNKFNAFLKSFSKSLNVYEQSFSDTEMDEIRDLIIENIKNIREMVIELIVLMKDVGAENFVQDALQKYKSIIETSEQVEGIIRDEWFGHIDYDILGKIKIGHSIPLVIK